MCVLSATLNGSICPQGVKQFIKPHDPRPRHYAHYAALWCGFQVQGDENSSLAERNGT